MLIVMGLFHAAPTVPQGVQYYVPVEIQNTQANATGINFQQMVNVDSAQYSQYEAPNLQNVVFFYGNGQTITSWMEGNPYDPQQTTNLYQDGLTTYWLKLQQSIQANSNLIIYMGFASTGTNLFNNYNNGEAPWLSSTYGQYDDGQDVFLAYFNGDTSTSQFTTTSGYSVSQQYATFGQTTIPVIQFTGTSPGINVYFQFNQPIQKQNLIVETSFEPEDVLATTGTVGLVNINPPAYTGMTTYLGPISGSYGYSSGFSQGQWYFGTMYYAQASGWIGYLSDQLYTGCYCNLINSDPLANLGQVYMGAGANMDDSNQANIYFNFGRARMSPPDGVMPSVLFAQVVNNMPIQYYTVTISENPVSADGGWDACVGQTQGSQICAGNYNGGTNSNVSVPAGTVLTYLCTANNRPADKSYTFSSWAGAVGSGYQSNPCPFQSGISASITVNGNVNIQANYVPSTPALVANLPTTSSSSITAGQSSTLTANPSGGKTPYAGYTWYGGSSSNCLSNPVLPLSSSASAVSVSPSASEYYCYTVTDSAGTQATSGTVLISVSSAPPTLVANPPTASPSPITAGQSSVLTSNPSGGTAPYVGYTWYGGSSSSCLSNAVLPYGTSTIFVSPASNEYYCYTVTDTAGKQATSSTTLLTVNPIPVTPTALTANPPAASQSTITVGQNSILLAEPSGGTAPYVAFSWYGGASSNCALDTGLSLTGSSATVTPSSNEYYCYVVTDSAGNHATSTTILITVNAAPVQVSASGGGSFGLGPSVSFGSPVQYVKASTPSVLANNTCDYIVNSTEGSYATIAVGNTTYDITNRYMYDNESELMVNGSVFALAPGQKALLPGSANRNLYLASMKVITSANHLTTQQVATVGICVGNAQPQIAAPPFTMVHLTLNISMSNFTIISTGSVKNDTIYIFINGTQVAQGPGSAEYNFTWIPAGRHLVEGKDIDSGTFINKTIVKPYFTPQLSFTTVCPNSTVATPPALWAHA